MASIADKDQFCTQNIAKIEEGNIFGKKMAKGRWFSLSKAPNFRFQESISNCSPERNIHGILKFSVGNGRSAHGDRLSLLKTSIMYILRVDFEHKKS